MKYSLILLALLITACTTPPSITGRYTGTYTIAGQTTQAEIRIGASVGNNYIGSLFPADGEDLPTLGGCIRSGTVLECNFVLVSVAEVSVWEGAVLGDTWQGVINTPVEQGAFSFSR